MRKTAQSLTLMLALSAPAFAGEMQCPVVNEPPPPPSAVQEATTTDGSGEPGAADGLLEIALGLMDNVLALL
ncbi:MAG TPA: hypothetical protein VEY09_13720 [Pyrinomonadaceae bacterium]|nr:hypothetical protein [Pyrinomonadaceae bacterium]